MTRAPMICTLFGWLSILCLAACAGNQGAPVAPQPVTYSLSTPLSVIENDPRGLTLIRRDIPDVVYNPHYAMSPLNSIMDIENLSGAKLPQQQLARTQLDLAQLSAEEQGAQNAGTAPLQALPIYTTSFTCQDGNTPVQNAVCENPQLASLDVQLGSLFQQHMGSDSVFERDQVLASEQAWDIGLAAACNISAQSAGPGATAISCLTNAYQAQIAVLANWPPPELSAADTPSNAIANYVHYKLLDAKQPSLCTALGAQAAGAMSDDGSIDPARLTGAAEIAGSHGNPSGSSASGNIFVDFHRAGLYAGYQVRARSLTVAGGATPLIGPTSVGDYVQTMPNGGGRFVSFASQTGDYGDIDVFTLDGQLLALVTDTIGYNSPVPPGEAAVAAVYTISQNTATPACLFQTYLMPPPLSMGTFAAQPSLTPFLALIDQVHGQPSVELAASDREDASYFTDYTRWMLFNMPLVIVAEAKAGDWTGWLRSRHDQVLDALFTWSQKNPENQDMFKKLFILMRPASVDLDTVYVQQQGLAAADAEQATAVAMMELLYQSTTNFAPGLGRGPADPSAYRTYQPRYPILASPQS